MHAKQTGKTDKREGVRAGGAKRPTGKARQKGWYVGGRREIKREAESDVSDAKTTKHARLCALSCPEGGKKRVNLNKPQGTCLGNTEKVRA